MSVTAAIDMEIAANLFDEPKDEFHPKPFALVSLESGRSSSPVVQYRQRISTRPALFKANGDIAVCVFHRVGDQLVRDKPERAGERRRYLNRCPFDHDGVIG